MNGKVYLVGAGPGDPGLITVRGVECLRQAKVVVYDRLASPDLLQHAPASAERLYVGKASREHTLSQSDLNALLVQKAREGKIVVRLKGGDPFVFGRGGEEALALAEAGIPFEIVPGVSSAIAVPAYAGIPVTQRGMAASLAVITGHREKTAGPRSQLPIPAAETQVFMMGVENLENIVMALLEQSQPADTPAAVIQQGTTWQQKTIVGTLGDMVERSRGIEPPAVLVVGQVVTLRDKLCWFEHRPLFGKRILVTRAREQASELSALLKAQGAEPVELPVIRIEPVRDTMPLDQALNRRHDWVIFTSVNGVRAVWARLEAAGLDARAFSGTRLCAIGPATAEALAAHGLRADLVPREYVAEAILASIGDVTGQRILLPRADMAREALAQGLRHKGAAVDEVTAYHTVHVGADDPQAQEVRALLAAGQIDAITFTSSSTVRGWARLQWPVANSPWPCIACIGPITAQTARDLGLPVDVVAREYTLEGLVAALIAHYRASEP